MLHVRLCRWREAALQVARRPFVSAVAVPATAAALVAVVDRSTVVHPYLLADNRCSLDNQNLAMHMYILMAVVARFTVVHSCLFADNQCNGLDCL